MKWLTTIRTATPEDLPAIERLVGAGARACGAPDLAAAAGGAPGQHLLVLDGPDGELAAAALLAIEGARGHLALLAVAPHLAGCGLEVRMIGVVAALCAAFGAALDVPARRAA